MTNSFLSDIEKADRAESAFFNAPGFFLEQVLLKHGFRRIAGIDEAGRGALAGPLAVGMVVFNVEDIIASNSKEFLEISDSKKLSPKKREEAIHTIKSISRHCSVEMVSHKIIDRMNVNKATHYAIEKLLLKSDEKPDFLLVDGRFNFSFEIPSASIVKGDQKSLSIAAASIMAKVYRDSIMDHFNKIYEGYKFSSHKGYGTLVHREAIESRGFCPIHRRSFEPVKSMIIKV